MKKVVFALSVFAVPFFVSAQNFTSFNNIFTQITVLINSATPVIFGIALIAFLWGLARFVFSAGNEDAQKEAKSIMIWGVIALFVMSSVWGLVNILTTSFGLDSDTPVSVPKLPTQ